MHHTPESIENGAKFALTQIAQELRAEPQFAKSGHATRTLVRAADLRVVISLLAANGQIPEHQAPGTVSIHVLSGQLRLKLPSRSVDVGGGELLVLEAGMPHEVTAQSEAVFMLTLAWRDDFRHETSA